MNTPTFVCDRIERNPDIAGSLVVSFRCSACGKRHFHSWGKDEAGHVPQHRVGHCDRSRLAGGYYITLVNPELAHLATGVRQ